jgi:hypothetical protein
MPAREAEPTTIEGMPADPQPRRRFQFSLWTLLVAITLTGPIVLLVYGCTRPFYIEQRIDCGGGRYVTILRPNEFCDNASRVYYQITGMKDGGISRSFDVWGCGITKTRVWKSDDGDVIGIAAEFAPDEIEILVDFKTGESWPADWDRQVDAGARDMLSQLNATNGPLWLSNTYDGELTKPHPF